MTIGADADDIGEAVAVPGGVSAALAEDDVVGAGVVSMVDAVTAAGAAWLPSVVL